MTFYKVAVRVAYEPDFYESYYLDLKKAKKAAKKLEKKLDIKDDTGYGRVVVIPLELEI